MVIPISDLYVSIQPGSSSFGDIYHLCTTREEAQTLADEASARDLVLRAQFGVSGSLPYQVMTLTEALENIRYEDRQIAIAEHEAGEDL